MNHVDIFYHTDQSCSELPLCEKRREKNNLPPMNHGGKRSVVFGIQKNRYVHRLVLSIICGVGRYLRYCTVSKPVLIPEVNQFGV